MLRKVKGYEPSALYQTCTSLRLRANHAQAFSFVPESNTPRNLRLRKDEGYEPSAPYQTCTSLRLRAIRAQAFIRAHYVLYYILYILYIVCHMLYITFTVPPTCCMLYVIYYTLYIGSRTESSSLHVGVCIIYCDLICLPSTGIPKAQSQESRACY